MTTTVDRPTRTRPATLVDAILARALDDPDRPCLIGADETLSWGAFAARDPQANAAHLDTLFRLWSEGKISPKVSRTWPLAEGGDAIAHMAARGAVGKLVVTMD